MPNPQQSAADKIARAKSRVGVLARKSVPSTAEQVAEAKAELAAANIEAAIEKALRGAPPLSEERAQRIAALLLAGGAE